ncbi:DegT/DnrJ/EryC1/StrS family aminotransferase [Skermanella pratensis]|uniref:DegT/DnrJ/EryC1/StrS family aminotransferase n=1 Tax=Skermanella pratensis TaxID=2233999 RepID=UPI001301078D|nr:DegT/DnrJ/EryC1/StrS family aminotransferase [Skermanella pratensis]
MTDTPGLEETEDSDDELPGDIALTQPDIGAAETRVIERILTSASLNDGRLTEAFEEAFAAYVGRRHAVAVTSGTMAMMLALKAYGFGPGDDILCSPYGWHQVVHAVALAGANPVFSDIDYWSHTLNPVKAAERITSATRAIIAGNTNGHPAPWDELRALASERGVVLIEDSTEAIGSTYHGRIVGSFGDCAVFDFSEPGPLLCGEGGMIVTDDDDLASRLRYLRKREPEHLKSVVISHNLPWQSKLSNLNAALGLVQLKRIDEILERRRAVVGYYEAAMQSFEGIKPPYHAPGVTVVHCHAYAVHLGTRFSVSLRNAVIEDMLTQGIDSASFGVPLHIQQFYAERGGRRGDCPVAEKTADRVIAVPFHGALDQDEVEFIVQRLKDATVNSGAGAAIY